MKNNIIKIILVIFIVASVFAVAPPAYAHTESTRWKPFFGDGPFHEVSNTSKGLTYNFSAEQTGNGKVVLKWDYETDHDVTEHNVYYNGNWNSFEKKTDGHFYFSKILYNQDGRDVYSLELKWKPTCISTANATHKIGIPILPAPIVEKPTMTETKVTNASTGKSSITVCARINTFRIYTPYFIVNGISYVAKVSSCNTYIFATIDGLDHDTDVSVTAKVKNVAGSDTSSEATFRTARVKNSNNTITSVNTSAGTATKVSDTAYALTVPFSTTAITIFPVLSDTERATVKVGSANYQKSGSAFGSYSLSVGENSFTITSSAENGSTKTHTLTVVRQVPAPVIQVTTAKTTQYRSAKTGYTQFVLSGTVSGGGSQVSVSASIVGKTKSTTINTPASGNADWSLQWDAVTDSIAQGDYSGIVVTADNGSDMATAAWAAPGILKVDRTAPTAPTFSSVPSPDKTVLTITPGTDSGAGVQNTEYRIGSEKWGDYSSPITVSTNGTTVISARTTDKVGNVSNVSTTSVYVNNTPPKPPTISGNENWTNSNVSVYIFANPETADIVDYTQYKLSGGYTTYSVMFTISTEGITPITSRSISKTGVTGETAVKSVRIDKTAPTISTVTGNPTSWTNDNATLSVTASDGYSGLDAVAYSFDNSVTWQAGNTKTYTENTSGIVIKVRDKVGNVSTHSTINITRIDKTVPTVSSVSGNPTEWQNTDATISVTASDEQSGIAQYSFDGGETWQADSFKAFSQNTSFVLKVKDSAGNITTFGTVNITKIDKTLPVISVAEATRTATNSAAIAFSLSENARVYYTVVADGAAAPSVTDIISTGTDAGAQSSGRVNLTVASLSTGAAYDVYVVAVDAAGNQSTAVKTDIPGGVTTVVHRFTGDPSWYMVGSEDHSIPLSDNYHYDFVVGQDGTAYITYIATVSGNPIICIKKFTGGEMTETDVFDWELIGSIALTTPEKPILKFNSSNELFIFARANVDGHNKVVGYKMNSENNWTHLWTSSEDVNALGNVKLYDNHFYIGALNSSNNPIVFKTNSTNLTELAQSTATGITANGTTSSHIDFTMTSTGRLRIGYTVAGGNGFRAAVAQQRTFGETIWNERLSPVTVGGVDYSVYELSDVNAVSIAADGENVFIALYGRQSISTSTTDWGYRLGTVDQSGNWAHYHYVYRNQGPSVAVHNSVAHVAINANTGAYLYCYAVDASGANVSKAYGGSFDTGYTGGRAKLYITSEGQPYIAYLSDSKLRVISYGIAPVEHTGYYVSFDTFGGTAYETQIRASGEKAENPGTPTETGYTFGGWYSDSSLTTIYDFDSAVNSTRVIYAKFTPNTYTLTYNYAGGSGTPESKSVTYAQPAGALSVPTRTNYDFGGWWTGSGGTGTQVTESTVTTGSFTAYAYWIPRTYSLSFDGQGGSVPDVISVTYGSAISGTAFADSAMTGYTFGGWWTGANGSGSRWYHTTTFNNTADTTLYAKWTIDSYDITFLRMDGATVIADETVDFGSSVSPPAAPDEPGYAFTGWSSVGYKYVTEDADITGQYEAIPAHTIEASAGPNGSISATPAVIYQGDDVTYTFTPNAHYRVADVVVDGNSQGALSEYGFTGICGNHTISVTFVPETYTVTFRDASGGVLKTQTVTYGGNASAPEIPSREGWDTDGWDGALSNITQDTVLTAQYTEIPSYLITASAGDGGSITPEGEAEVLRGQKKSYSFTPNMGYQIDTVHVDGTPQTDAHGNPVSEYTFSDVSAPNTISVTFSPISYTVIFKDYNGTILSTQTVEHDDDAAPPSVLRTGHTFTGWNTSYKAVTRDMELTAQYTINRYTVTFDSNGGDTTVAAVTGNYGEKVALPSAPTRLNHTFEGWYKDAACTQGNEWLFSEEDEIAADTIPTNNVTLYAKWLEKQYMVYFVDPDDIAIMVNGEEFQLVTHGDAASAPALPADCSDWSLPYNSITADTTIKAVRAPEPIVITFKWNYSGSSADITMEADGDNFIYTPGQEDRTGYNFIGWFSNSGGTGTQLESGAKVFENATYYAKWQPIEYEVKFVGDDKQTIITRQVTFGQDAVPPAAPALAGYRFVGWDRDYTNVQSNIVVTALYDEIPKYSFEVSYGAMGSITPGEGAWVYEGEDMTFTITPLPGYTVSKLFVDGVDAGAATGYTFSDVQNNHVISADFKLQMHTVTFKTHDGTTISTQTVPHGGEAQVPATIERLGYTFTGWSKATDNVTEDMTVSATYQAKMYTVSFDTNDSSIMPDTLVAYDEKITQPETPEKTGHSFSGWYKGEDLEDEWLFSSDRMPASSITLYAKWAKKTYNVRFVDYDDTLIVERSVPYGEAAQPPNNPLDKMIGGVVYDFDGWSADYSCITVDSKIKALYMPIKHMLTFDADYVSDGRTDSDKAYVLVDDTSKAPAPPNPERTGFTFDGWYTGHNGGGTAFSPNDTVTADATYYAKWTVKAYGVMFELDGGTFVPGGGNLSQSVTFLGAAEAPSDPEKYGYMFIGWDKDFSAVTDPMTVTALYSKIPVYTISVQAGTGGAISPASVTVLKGENAAFTITASDGYTLAGVTVNGDAHGSVASYTFENVHENSSISAEFEANTYTVTFNAQNEEPASSLAAAFGSKLVIPADPMKTGYRFVGWYTDAEGTLEWSFHADTVPSENITLFAKWTARTYQVSFFNNRGEGNIIPQIKTFGAAYGEPDALPVLTQDGYEFEGWWTETDGEGEQITDTSVFDMAGDVLLYAKWVEEQLNAPTAEVVKADSSSYTWGEWTNTSKLTITAASVDNGAGIQKYQYRTDSDLTWKDMAGDDLDTLEITESVDKTYFFRAVSMSGVAGEVSEACHIMLDNTKPQIVSMQIRQVGDEWWEKLLNVISFGIFFQEKIEVEVGFLDEHSGATTLMYKFVPDGTAPGSVAYTSYALTDDDKAAGFKVLQNDPDFQGTFVAYMIDKAGNDGEAASGKFINENNAPTVTFDAETGFDSANWYKQVKLSFTAQDTEAGLDKIEIYENNVLKKTWAGSFTADADGLNTNPYSGTYTVTTKGQYPVMIKAYDKSGNVAQQTIHVKIVRYGVTYDKNDAVRGSVPADSTEYGKGETATILGNTGGLGKTGYTFTGWNTSANGTGTTYQAGNKIVIQGDVSLYAVWQINSYTVRFEDWDGTQLKRQTVEYGKSATAPKNPDRTGYTFAGWDKLFSFILGDMTVTANYNINYYTVSFNTNGGGSVASQSVAYLHTVTKPVDPEKSGFTFDGWYADSALTVTYDFAKKVEGNLTLFAKWRENRDVVREVAKGLTANMAFKFADGGTWECVTSDFIMLSSGENGVQVVWTSSNENVVRIEGSGESVSGIVTRPQDRDVSVIITATISKGDASVTKTFLLVIKRQGASKQETRNATERTATVQIGQNVGTDTIYRTALNDGTNIDTVLVTPETIQRLLKQSGNTGIAVVTIDRYDADPADEFAFEVSADSVAKLAANNLGLTLSSPEGIVTLSAEALKRANENGTDLYFRIVSVPDEAEEAAAAFRNDGTILSLTNGHTGEALGVPRIIQTNMEGFAVTVRFPLDGIDKDSLSDPDFLSSLRIYVEHDDDTTELINGEIIYENEIPVAIEFEISSFSRFQIVSVEKSSSWLNIGLWIGGVIILIVLVGILIVVCRRRKREQRANT